MADEWYWKHRGETRGPISTEDLDELIRHHRIDNRDELRPVESDEWISGSTVKAMFAGGEFDAKATVDAARRLLKQKLPSASSGNTDPSGGGISPPIVKAVKGATHFLGGVGELIISGLSAPFFALRQFYSPWLGLIVSLLILISIPLSRMDFTGAENRKAYDQLAEIVGKVQQLDESDADDAEWKRFRDGYQSVIEVTRRQLMQTNEKQAGQFRLWQWDSELTNQLARRSLIQVAYDLEGLLSSTADYRPVYLSTLESDLNAANEALSGKTLERLQFQRSAARTKKTSKLGESIDPMVAGILAVDALLLVGAGVFVWRRFMR